MRLESHRLRQRRLEVLEPLVRDDVLLAIDHRADRSSRRSELAGARRNEQLDQLGHRMLDVIGDGKGHGRERQSPRAELRRVLLRTPHAGLLPWRHARIRWSTKAGQGHPASQPTVSLAPRPTRPSRRSSKVAQVLCVDVAVGGIFGPRTEAGVKATQRFLHITVHGSVGPVTWQGPGRQWRLRSGLQAFSHLIGRAAARTRSTERSAVVPGQTWCQSEREAVRDPSSLGVATHARDGAR
jgi:hypothetical protein